MEELIKLKVTKTRPGQEGPVTQLSEEIHKMDPSPSNSNGSGVRDKKNLTRGALLDSEMRKMSNAGLF